MASPIPLLLLVLLGPSLTGIASESASFRLLNSCKETIWPAISPSLASGGVDLPTMGFALAPGESKNIPAPESWSGRIWARTHCSEDSTGGFSCVTGDCGSGSVECTGQTGFPPATISEFQTGSNYYAVSLVEGFNIPMRVLAFGGYYSECRTKECAADLIASCPEELKMTDGNGKTVACKGPCQAFQTEECKPTKYSQMFDTVCPLAYSYPNVTESMPTNSCFGSALYEISFCPPPQSSVSVDGTSILKPGNQLHSSSELVSQGGNFTLGFFKLPDTNLYYLGIWYTALSQRKVWVANPNSPIDRADDDIQLIMDSTGNLGLLSGGNFVTNIAGEAVTNNNTIAVLLDSGNFVLMDSGSRNRTLWQSFDYPADTLLPGMKLGFNLTARQNWTLVSCLNDNVTALGAFTMSLERTDDSGEIVIRRRGQAYWRSGPWGTQGFPLLTSLNNPLNPVTYKLDFITDNHAMYFTFGASSNLAMLRLSPDGHITDGENKDLSLIPKFCYGYENDDGCVASGNIPSCRSKMATFELKSGIFWASAMNSDYDGTSTIT